MRRLPGRVRGITTIEYLLAMAFLTTLLVGVAAIMRTPPIVHVPDSSGAFTDSPTTNPTGETNGQWLTATVLAWQVVFFAGLSVCFVLVHRISRLRSNETIEFRRRVKREEFDEVRESH